MLSCVLDEMYVLSCEWNYCTDHCDTGKPESHCKAAEANGVHLVHGNRLVFEHNNQPMFRAMFKAFEEVIVLI